MKGLVFTLDAVFALLIASAGVSILLYFVYTSPIPYNLQYSSSSGLFGVLASTKINSLSYVPMAAYISAQQASSGEHWDQMFGNPHNNAGNAHGPQSLMLSYTFDAQAPISNGTILSDYGNIYFAAGNEMYALNASSGNELWSAPSPYNSSFGDSPGIMSSVLYHGMLIYSTPANIVALNAQSGQQVWSSNTIFTSTHQVPRIFRYYDRIILQIYDISTSSLSIEILSAGNGTVIYESTSASSNPISHYATLGGQIATSTPAKLNLTTVLSTSTPPYADIWSVSVGQDVSGLAIYNGTIVYGSGPSAVALSSNSAEVFSSALDSAISGLSVYKGHAIFQTADEVSQADIFGYAGWNTIMPQSYGTPVANATPVISLQNVYTLWSKSNLVAMNLSTGAIIGTTVIPYSGYLDPYMAIAYGRLFVSKGSHLMAYGACAADASESLLSAVATLYVNGEGSCGSYLLSSLSGASNSGISINGRSAESAAYFDGSGRIFDPEAFIPSQSCNMTIIAWSNYTGASTSPTHGVVIFNSSNPSGIMFGTGSVKFEAGSSSDTWNAAGSFGNSWVMSAIVFNKYSAPSGYIDGSVYPDTNPYAGCPGIGNATMGVSGGSYFNGFIADVQVYNSSLSASQIGQLYGEGVSAQPLSGRDLVAWFPLSGGPDNFALPYSSGYPFSVNFNSIAYKPVSMQNAYSIASQSAPLAVFNYTTGAYRLYNIGIYSWR
ncbi:PQQ-binding-like beta-propeller repeat protein [Candidatus Marsarchaeota archaeon]|nr:PQQ-binding-like beta-propeller repeat protein [Candidatus Marsarchaeota archaeon]